MWHKLVSILTILFLISARSEAFRTIDQTSNQCPKSKPWPCRTPNVCLSFALICDGEIDCPDEYDEDPDMCTAKDRPAEEHLQGFINKYRRWLIPNILGEGTPIELATKLVESRTIVDYAKDVHLTEEQAKKLVQFFNGIKSGKQIVLLLLGMPLGAWTELYELFSRIYKSGFMDTVDELPGVQSTEKRFRWNIYPYQRMRKWIA